jgi:hypothetical protein
VLDINRMEFSVWIMVSYYSSFFSELNVSDCGVDSSFTYCYILRQNLQS